MFRMATPQAVFRTDGVPELIPDMRPRPTLSKQRRSGKKAATFQAETVLRQRTLGIVSVAKSYLAHQELHRQHSLLPLHNVGTGPAGACQAAFYHQRHHPVGRLPC